MYKLHFRVGTWVYQEVIRKARKGLSRPPKVMADRDGNRSWPRAYPVGRRFQGRLAPRRPSTPPTVPCCPITPLQLSLPFLDYRKRVRIELQFRRQRRFRLGAPALHSSRASGPQPSRSFPPLLATIPRVSRLPCGKCVMKTDLHAFHRRYTPDLPNEVNASRMS